MLRVLPEVTPKVSCDRLNAVNRIAWAVRAASRLVPRTTCLPQAMAATTLLRRAGFAADLRLGVAKDNKRTLNAHAWVEIDGEVVFGGADSQLRYRPLLTFQEKDIERHRWDTL